MSDLAGDAGPVTEGERVSKMGKMQGKGKLGEFHVYCGNVNAIVYSR